MVVVVIPVDIWACHLQRGKTHALKIINGIQKTSTRNRRKVQGQAIPTVNTPECFNDGLGQISHLSTTLVVLNERFTKRNVEQAMGLRCQHLSRGELLDPFVCSSGIENQRISVQRAFKRRQ